MAAWADEGLAAHERVVVVQSGDGAELRDRGVDVLSPEAVYLSDGVFDIDRCIEASRAFIEQSVAEGYAAVRLASDAQAVLDVVDDIGALLAYERRVDALCHTVPVSGICFYDRATFGPALSSFVAAHPHGAGDAQLVGSCDVGRVQFTGDVDLSNIDLFEALLTAATVGADDVVVDLSALSFIDVVGATTLVTVSRGLAPRGRMKVVSPPALLVRMLETMGATNLDVVPSEVAA